MRARLQAAFVSTALLLSSVLSAWAQGEADLQGWWSGSYTCRQGLTKLDLSVSSVREGRTEALFHFGAMPSNPAVPEGCFSMQGVFDPVSRRVLFLPEGWLLRPDGWLTVGLYGQIDPSAEAMAGQVTGDPSCKSFTLRRLSRVPERTEACGPARIT